MTYTIKFFEATGTTDQIQDNKHNLTLTDAQLAKKNSAQLIVDHVKNKFGNSAAAYFNLRTVFTTLKVNVIKEAGPEEGALSPVTPTSGF